MLLKLSAGAQWTGKNESHCSTAKSISFCSEFNAASKYVIVLGALSILVLWVFIEIFDREVKKIFVPLLLTNQLSLVNLFTLSELSSGETNFFCLFLVESFVFRRIFVQ